MTVSVQRRDGSPLATISFSKLVNALILAALLGFCGFLFNRSVAHGEKLAGMDATQNGVVSRLDRIELKLDQALSKRP